jgi:hypothetical protein
MEPTLRSSGVTFSTFGPVNQPKAGSAGRSKRATATSESADALAGALSQWDLQLVDVIEMEVQPSGRPAKRGEGVPESGVTLDIPLQQDESAIVLVNDEGEYRWIVRGEEIPVQSATPAVPRKRGRGGAGAPVHVKQMRFTVQFNPAPSEPAGATKRGLVRKILGKVTVYLLKFAARIALPHVVRFLERHVRQGIVVINATKPEGWNLIEGDVGSRLTLPPDRPARVLLFIHGTFSSTKGSFISLLSNAAGEEFLARALEHYDAVLGFEHATLSVDPFVNATDLIAGLQRIAWPRPPVFDIIAYSRGGLVTRSFIEQVLPPSGWPAVIGRVVFAGCTNRGTLLAEPDNWQRFADLYTNLAMAACSLIAYIPGMQAARLVGETIQGVGALVKALTIQGIKERGIPGLAAMEPDGEFVREINKTQPGQPSAAEAFYCAITSDFEAQKALAGSTTPELPPKFLLRMVDAVTDRLYGEPNDLVVNTSSMTYIDPQAGAYVKDVLDFGTNNAVYHTNYFSRPETAAALMRWLRLDSPQQTQPRGAVRGRQPTSAGGLIGFGNTALVSAGGVVVANASAAVRTNFRVINAREPIARALQTIGRYKPEYVIVERIHAGQLLRYAFTVDEMKNAAKGRARQSVEDALGLHETDQSPVAPASETVAPRPLAGASRPSLSRVIIVSGNQAVGIVPSSAELPEVKRHLSMAKPPLSTSSGKKKGGGGGKRSFAPIKYAMAAGRSPLKRGRPGATLEMVGRSAALPTPPSTAAAPAPTRQVECHFQAEMDEEVVVNETTDVEVTISREMLQAAVRGASATARAKLDASRKCVVQIAARKNFRIEGERRVEISIPKPGDPTQVYFDVTGLIADTEGELWVQVRQGAVPLVTLKLFPRIVAERISMPRRSRAAAGLAEFPPFEKPLDQLIIDENFIGTSVQYEYYLDLPSIKFKKKFSSVPLPGARDEYIKQILNEIGDAWAGQGANGLKAFENSLKSIGGNMFDQLFPREMQELLWNNRQKIRSVQVLSMEPFVPWEMLYVKNPAQRILPADSLFLGEMGLVHWLYEGYPPQKINLRNGRVRYLNPVSANLKLPEAADEVLMLENLFKATPVDPNLFAFQTFLSDPGACDLFHYVGHGEAAGTKSANARLFINGSFENDLFVGEALTAKQVEQMAQLKQADHQPIVVLNCCESARRNREFTGMGGFADAFVKSGAGVFIGTRWSVGDAPARTFIDALYGALTSKQKVSLSDAVSKARKAARDGGDATWLAYVVYGHPMAIVEYKK